MTIGRPRGQRKAERKLAREIATKQFQSSLATGGLTAATEFIRTANSNPVIGLGLGIVAVDLLYRAGAISFTAAAAFYALLSTTVAGGIISDLAAFIPSFGTKEAKDAVQPTASTLYYGDSKTSIPLTTRSVTQ